MGVRGRKTSADKVVAIRELSAMDLPPAPANLSKDEAKEWVAIVETYPADRFPRGTWPMLEMYCQHAVQGRKISKRINALPADVPIRDLNTLLMMLDRESKAVASFGIRLGIARTSMPGRHNNDPDTVAERGLPWEEN
jgi:hypothetical protein